MNYLRTACGLLALWGGGMAWSADALTPHQKEVTQFVEKMYSYDPDTFEFGEFSKKMDFHFCGIGLLRMQGNMIQQKNACYYPRFLTIQ